MLFSTITTIYPKQFVAWPKFCKKILSLKPLRKGGYLHLTCLQVTQIGLLISPVYVVFQWEDETERPIHYCSSLLLQSNSANDTGFQQLIYIILQSIKPRDFVTVLFKAMLPNAGTPQIWPSVPQLLSYKQGKTLQNPTSPPQCGLGKLFAR